MATRIDTHRMRSNLLYGAAKSLDMRGQLHDARISEIRRRFQQRDSDANAIRGDWESIARDAGAVIQRIKSARGRDS